MKYIIGFLGICWLLTYAYGFWVSDSNPILAEKILIGSMSAIVYLVLAVGILAIIGWMVK